MSKRWPVCNWIPGAAAGDMAIRVDRESTWAMIAS